MSVNGSRRGKIAVLDRALLASVAEWVEWHQDRTHRFVSQPTLWRLRNQKSDTISQETLTSLEAALVHHGGADPQTGHLFDQIQRATLSAQGMALKRQFYVWMYVRSRQLFDRQLTTFQLTPGGVREIEDNVEGDLRAVDGTIGGLAGCELSRYRRFLALLWRLEQLRPASGYLDRLRDEIADRFEPEGHRFTVALLNILEPLLEGAESGFIERSWEELTDEELNTFVAKGIDRERILLRRVPNPERIQAAVGGSHPASSSKYDGRVSAMGNLAWIDPAGGGEQLSFPPRGPRARDATRR